MKDIALEIDNLTVSTNKGTILVDKVSFSLKYGKIAALVGESGCGKTMTTAAVMGLLPFGVHKTSGIITIAGKDTSTLSAEEYRKMRNNQVSVIMQNPMSAFDPVLTIWYHFRETLASQGCRDMKIVRKQAENSLISVGFQDPSSMLDLYPFQMSGGMLQRIMLAIALINAPPLIIADEATTDLDMVAQTKILTLLKEHCLKNNSALLLITHDLSVAKSLAEEVILMKSGSIAEHNRTGLFFQNPQSEYAKTLLSCYNGLYTERFSRIISNIRSNYASS